MNIKQSHSGVGDNIGGDKNTGGSAKNIPLWARWILFVVAILTLAISFINLDKKMNNSIEQNHSGIGDNVGGDKYTNIADADINISEQEQHVLSGNAVYTSAYEVVIESQFPIETLRITALETSVLKDGVEIYPADNGIINVLRTSYTPHAGAVEVGNMSPGTYRLKVSQSAKDRLVVSSEIIN